MNTNNTFMVIVGTVKKSMDTVLTEVIVEKGLPRLTGRSAEPSQNTGNGAFGDRDTEHP
jgi:hypothetical protein